MDGGQTMVKVVVELKEMMHIAQGIVSTGVAVTIGRDGFISFYVLFVANIDEAIVHPLY